MTFFIYYYLFFGTSKNTAIGAILWQFYKIQIEAKKWKYSDVFSKHRYIPNYISKRRYIIQLHPPFYAFYDTQKLHLLIS